MQNNLSPNYLPISKYSSIIVQMIAKNTVTVISGKTGCGKSTQIPQYILKEFPTAKIAICQPRRIAATSLAVRVSEQMGSKLGHKVGYHIGMQHFKQQTCSIVYMTYGILIQQLLFHQTLKFSHIILDQIHERSLQMDFTFVAMKNILNTKYKDKIKLIIMSATLNSDQFAQYFATDQHSSFFIPQIIPAIKQSQVQRRGGRQRRNKANTIEQSYSLTQKASNFKSAAKFELNQDKQYKVFQYFLDDMKSNSEFYTNVDNQQFIPEDAYKLALDIIIRQRNGKDKCDILVFVPGLFEIRTLKKQLQTLQVHSSQIIQVHSLFSQELYSKLFNPTIINKIILATNIGQSSITLPFCKIVIDFCLSRKNYSKSKGVTRLQTRMASQASLTQRSGRVGRVSDGVVYRMISKDLYKSLPQYEKPEIQCVSLEMIILKVKQMDTINQNNVFRNPYNFLMMTINPPEISDIKQALDQLIKEDALIGEQGQTSSDIQNSSKLSLTQVGMFMVSMPCDLQVSKMMLMGLKIGIPFVIIRIASIIMCTKTFFVHEDRRFCMQNFMHYLVQYDNKRYNDYLLRQRMYTQWRGQFYQKFKKNKTKQYKIKQTTSYTEQNKILQNQIVMMNLQKEQIQQNANILQDFNQQKWSKQELQWCKYRGINLNAMRQIIRIEQGIKSRLSSFNLKQDKPEMTNNQLILLCLDYGFPFNDLQICWKDSSSISKNKGVFTFQLPYHQDYDIPFIHDYLRPEKDYTVTALNHQKAYLIQGSSSVICKCILPSIYSGKFDQTSSIFYHLNKKKIIHQYKSQIYYKRSAISIFSDSINKACIPLKPYKNYRLLTHKFTEIKYKKMVQMCALIEQQMFHRMQLITMKEVKIALHPSKQFYGKYKIQDATYEFKSFVGQKEINMINSMRRIARRQKNNKIYSSQQQMSVQDIQLLLNLITKDTRQQHKQQPWQYYYLLQNSIDINYTFYPIQDLPTLSKTNSYYKNYQKWKTQYYYNFLNFYRCLIMQHCHLICNECYPKQIKEIQQIRKFSNKDNILKLNQYSGNWNIKKELLYCKNDHLIGTVLNQDQAMLDRSKLKIYIPFRIIEDLWQQWPSQQEIMMRIAKGKQLIQEEKYNINSFQCYFCYSYNDQIKEQQKKQFHKSQLKHNFWKKVMQHFRSTNHIKNMNAFCQSIKLNQSNEQQ